MGLNFRTNDYSQIWCKFVWEEAQYYITDHRLKMLRYLCRGFLLDVILEEINTPELLLSCLSQKFKNETLDVMMELLFRICVLSYIVEKYPNHQSLIKLHNNVKEKISKGPYVNTYRLLLFLLAKDGGFREAQMLASMNGERLDLRYYDLFDLLWKMETKGILKTGDLSQLALLCEQIGNESIKTAALRAIVLQDSVERLNLNYGDVMRHHMDAYQLKCVGQGKRKLNHQEMSAGESDFKKTTPSRDHVIENGSHEQNLRKETEEQSSGQPEIAASTRPKRHSENCNIIQDESHFKINGTAHVLKYDQAGNQVTSDLREQCTTHKIAAHSEERELMEPLKRNEPLVVVELNESPDIHDRETTFAPVACSEDHDSQYAKMVTSVSQLTPTSSLELVSPPCSMKMEYPIKLANRGYCVIIDNELFVKNDFYINTRRRGTGKDRRSLKYLFQELSLKVKVYENATAQRIRDIVDKYSRCIDHSCLNCFVLCILTHGTTGKLFGTDLETVCVQSIFESFSIERCQSLTGKPKVFLFESCRGNYKDIPFDTGTPESAYRDDEPRHSTSDACLTNIPDTLVGYSSSAGFQSFRHTDNGSWYIMSLTDVFRKYWKTTDVMSMMILVNEEVCKKEVKIQGTVCKQTPSIYSTFTKRLYFNQ